MRKLYRSRTNRRVAGICGGIGQTLDVDATLVRLVVLFLLLATGIVPLVVTYVVGWIVVPEEPEKGSGKA